MATDQILNCAADEVAKISGGESAMWAEGTKYTKEELERDFESHVITCLEDGTEPKDFQTWCIENRDLAPF